MCNKIQNNILPVGSALAKPFKRRYLALLISQNISNISCLLDTMAYIYTGYS